MTMDRQTRQIIANLYIRYRTARKQRQAAGMHSCHSEAYQRFSAAEFEAWNAYQASRQNLDNCPSFKSPHEMLRIVAMMGRESKRKRVA